MDNFKNINTTYGHHIGDRVLVEICKLFSAELDERSLISSYGGDGLIIAVPEVENLLQIKESVEEVLSKIKSNLQVEGKHISCTFSAGISTYPNDSIDVEELIRNAELAMCKAKNQGKSKCVIFDKEILGIIKRNVEIERCLRAGIINNEVYMVFQPKVLHKSGKIHGFEALVRWNSKELGFVSPAEFISVAEDTGIINDLGNFILNETFKKCKELSLETTDKFNIAINISEVQLRDENFISYVSGLLKKYELSPKYIEFEITEGVIMKSVARNIDILLELKELGFSIALDDFGTGYSSLNYLRRLPIDVLKIDKSFIDGIGMDEKGEKIAESIIELAHNLDLLVVAEGVETKEQLIYLDTMNCDIIQGYYYSKPEKFSTIREMVINKITF